MSLCAQRGARADEPYVVPADAANAVAKTILHDAYWRGLWGGEAAVREKYLGRELAVYAIPVNEHGHLDLNVPDLHADFWITDAENANAVAEAHYAGKYFRSEEQNRQFVHAVLRLPSDVSTTTLRLDPRAVVELHVKRWNVARRYRDGEVVTFYLGTSRMYDDRIFYLYAPGKVAAERVTIARDDRDLEEVEMRPRWGLQASAAEERHVVRRLLREGTRVRIRVRAR